MAGGRGDVHRLAGSAGVARRPRGDCARPTYSDWLGWRAISPRANRRLLSDSDYAKLQRFSLDARLFTAGGNGVRMLVLGWVHYSVRRCVGGSVRGGLTEVEGRRWLEGICRQVCIYFVFLCNGNIF